MNPETLRDSDRPNIWNTFSIDAPQEWTFGNWMPIRAHPLRRVILSDLRSPSRTRSRLFAAHAARYVSIACTNRSIIGPFRLCLTLERGCSECIPTEARHRRKHAMRSAFRYRRLSRGWACVEISPASGTRACIPKSISPECAGNGYGGNPQHIPAAGFQEEPEREANSRPASNCRS